MEDTFKETLACQKAIVIEQTFGHLAPKPREIYKGWLLFALDCFGDTNILDFEFENIEASPWFNSDIVHYIGCFTDKLTNTKGHGVFKFNGSYTKFKNGNHKFSGKVKEISCC